MRALQRIGDDVTKDTAWTGTVFDRAFYDSPECAPCRIKIPFFLQPDKVFAGPAWYRREIESRDDRPARVSPRRLLVCSIDLAGGLSAQPVARQLRASLLAYAQSDRIDPSERVSLEALQAALAP